MESIFSFLDELLRKSIMNIIEFKSDKELRVLNELYNDKRLYVRFWYRFYKKQRIIKNLKFKKRRIINELF
ncbi:TPA: hypothetical protein ACOTG0_002535 [Clostridium perfringens]